MSVRTGFIGIIIEDRHNSGAQVNALIAQYADIIVARLGIPRRQGRTSSVVTLVVEATGDQVGALTGKLGLIKGVSVKSALAREE